MSLDLSTKPALIVIDVQQGFDEPYWGKRNNPNAETNIAKLLAFWRANDLPIAHVKHNSTEERSPLRPELPGNAFKPEAEPLPTEKVFAKKVHSGFVGTALEKYLHSMNVAQVVIAGFTTNHCVETTTRMANNLGFTPFLVEDAAATFDRTAPNGRVFSAQELHDASLCTLSGEFATILTTGEVVSPP